jgi:hypothetical protein
MDERGQYVNIRDYKVIEEREPPSTSKAMKGIEILGIRLFSKWYEIPETC